MKTLVVLFAGSVSVHCYEKLFDGESAVERSINWAQTVSGVSRIDVFTSPLSVQVAPDNSTFQSEKIPLEIVFEERWTIASLIARTAERAAGFDAVVFGWADAPFYSAELTEKLLKAHSEYSAEYTFADGYPAGLTPEIIHPASAAILAELAKDDFTPVLRDSFFSVIKKDINSFEIETIISPKDVRYLRLSLFCGTKRDTLLCARLFSLCNSQSAHDMCIFLEKSAAVQRTLPAFYAIQIASPCRGSCSFCPYPHQYEKKYKKNPSQSADFMPLAQFDNVLKQIANFSEDAVISLSLWGDALLHPQFTDFAALVLKNEAFSLLIETDASALTAELAQKLADIVHKSPERVSGQKPINWIIALDSGDAELYKKLHGFDGFAQAITAIETLLPLFPKAVYPQFVRLQENETQLETFYRYWKEKSGNLIVQKYDWFSGLLENKKVADLTPVERNPCWHLRRDFHILIDGSVPQCKTAFFDATWGNVFTETLETIWARADNTYAEHVQCHYSGICEQCDEYYTFNF